MVAPVHQVAAGYVLPTREVAFAGRVADLLQVADVVAPLPEQHAVEVVPPALRRHQVIARPVLVRHQLLTQLVGVHQQIVVMAHAWVSALQHRVATLSSNARGVLDLAPQPHEGEHHVDELALGFDVAARGQQAPHAYPPLRPEVAYVDLDPSGAEHVAGGEPELVVDDVEAVGVVGHDALEHHEPGFGRRPLQPCHRPQLRQRSMRAFEISRLVQ